MAPEAGRRIPGMTLVSAQAVAPGCGALMVSVDELFKQEEPNAVLVWLDDGKLKSIAVEWNGCAVAVRSDPRPSALYLGEFGEIVRFDGNSFHEQSRIEGVDGRGPLRVIVKVNSLYTLAAGTALQVYRSTDWIGWTLEDVPSASSEPKADLSIESACASLAAECYAVGWEGLLCWRHKGTWRRIDGPTNIDLYAVTCAPNGLIYACGDEGTIIKGRAEAWEMIEQDVTREKLWGLTCYAGRVFVSGMHVLYELVDDRLVTIPAPDDGYFPSSTYRLVSSGGVLWSVGTKELFEFDGARWTPLITFFD